MILQKLMTVKKKLKSTAGSFPNTKVGSRFCRTIMKSIGRFLPSRMSSLVRRLLPIPGSSRIVRNIRSDLLRRRDTSTSFCQIIFLKCCICLILI